MIKTLMIIMLVTTGGDIRLFSRSFDTVAECKATIEPAVEAFKKVPDAAEVIAVCTNELQEVKKGLVA